MTIPWMMNCGHKDDGWCLECVKAMGDELADAKQTLERLSISVERDAGQDLAIVEAADPSEWKAGGDDEFYWCGPQSWGGGDLIQLERKDMNYDGGEECWQQAKRDCQFIAMAREALPYWIRRCVKAEAK